MTTDYDYFGDIEATFVNSLLYVWFIMTCSWYYGASNTFFSMFLEFGWPIVTQLYFSFSVWESKKLLLT